MTAERTRDFVTVRVTDRTHHALLRANGKFLRLPGRGGNRFDGRRWIHYVPTDHYDRLDAQRLDGEDDDFLLYRLAKQALGEVALP